MGDAESVSSVCISPVSIRPAASRAQIRAQIWFSELASLLSPALGSPTPTPRRTRPGFRHHSARVRAAGSIFWPRRYSRRPWVMNAASWPGSPVTGVPRCLGAWAKAMGRSASRAGVPLTMPGLSFALVAPSVTPGRTGRLALSRPSARCRPSDLPSAPAETIEQREGRQIHLEDR